MQVRIALAALALILAACATSMPGSRVSVTDLKTLAGCACPPWAAVCRWSCGWCSARSRPTARSRHRSRAAGESLQCGARRRSSAGRALHS